MKIFFDLDGTLIDSKMRLYSLFNYLVKESSITFDAYWALKQNRVPHKEILFERFNYSAEDISEFEKRWMTKIERSEWLRFDSPFEGVCEYLHKLSLEHQLYLVTARQSEAVVLEQIRAYGWSQIFEKIFVTGQKVEKYDLIIQNVKVKREDWFVGDTGKDIQTGKLLKINTAAVLSGFLNRERLMEYEPDMIVDSVRNLNFNEAMK